ncbi:MAG: DoxX family protein [Proteobacteria bacterium]|nr:DoxX family protein [Pseudomonadota bacterium]
MSTVFVERVIVSVVFGLAGLAKVLALAFETEAFVRWGFPVGFMYFIGILEIAGALGVWMRKLAPFAALCLAVLTVGAVATRLIFAEWVAAVVTAGVLAITLHFVWQKRRELFPH